MQTPRRLPVSVRHHWKVLAAGGTFCIVLVGALGDVRVHPYVVGGADIVSAELLQEVTNSTSLFDLDAPHDIRLSFTQDAYERMLNAYFADGEKPWLEADAVIDGVSVPNVGIRLKGNSTLASLVGLDGERSRMGIGGGGGPGGGPAGGIDVPQSCLDALQEAGAGQFGGGGPGGPADGRGGGPGAAFGATLDAKAPESLPWLISFDEFVEGRRYQGLRELAVRPAGANLALNEAVGLALIDAAGEPAQRFAYTSLTINDRPTTTRLVVEHPGDDYAGQISKSGVLYKALASGSFTYKGEDPTDYEFDFSQETAHGSQDLQPLIDLLKWVEQASDSEFATRLADHVDVESFARYLATQNLLLNFDDMAGPGRNYYLYYDLTSRTFTILTWDLNLALSGDATAGSRDTIGMGGLGRGGGAADGAMDPAPGDTGAPALPAGCELPGLGGPGGGPDGGRPQAGTDGGRGRGGGGFGGNALKERFLATEAFDEVYDKAYRELYQAMFASGAAERLLDAVVTAYERSDGGDAARARTQGDQLRSTLTTRRDALATDPAVTGVGPASTNGPA